MTISYADFLARKQQLSPPIGITGSIDLPAALKPFQAAITTWALRRGSAAVFAGTGLGKTLCELSWADAVRGYTGKPVLILAPLGVAHQTVREAEKFDISDVAYAVDDASITSTIVVTNYDRLHLFDLDKFAGVVLDESSIIKSHDGKTRQKLMEACRGIPFRLCATATPAPNDHVELGQHAEFLGVMSAKEMLATWFVHDGSIRATNVSNHGSKPVADWRLKRHAERDFWRWVSSWAVMIRHPRDLGFDEPGYDLPPLNIHQVTVPVAYRPNVDTGLLFQVEARTLQEQLAARRDSLDARVRAAAEIINAQPERPWLAWCHLNDEADQLVKLVPGAEQVAGSDSPEQKIRKLLGFPDGAPRVLVTKSKVAGFGMNFQHCADAVFVGLNHSYEGLYQSIRRCWRFGQARPVNAYLIAAETEGAVVANLKAKEAAAEEMAAAMLEHMGDLCEREVRGGRVATPLVDHSEPMVLPDWLCPQPKSEEWRDIFGGIYQVSDLGRVRRVSGGKGAVPNRILAQPVDSAGYPMTSICIDGKRTPIRTHVLVAEAFLGPRPEGREINHKDGVKANSRLSNLEYVTKQENGLHAWRTGLQPQRKRRSA